MTGAPVPTSPAERDAAATKRSYGFVIALSCGVWLLWAAVVISVGQRSNGDARWATLGIAAFTGLLLLGWVLFLRGLRRRDLRRIPGASAPAPPSTPRYDPRSR